MTTRRHTHQIELAASPQRVFAILHTPSAIRGWWSASRAIVLAEEGGTWAATWGASDDEPDYITVARIKMFDPPRRLVLTDYQYFARSGPLPFQADFTTDFSIEPAGAGSRLRVTQDGFPTDPIADAFYAGCETGWRNTFAGIKRFLDEAPI